MEEKLNDDNVQININQEKINNDNLIEINNKDLLTPFDEESERLLNRENIEEKKSKKSLINIFRNFEKDLIIKNDCIIEFDLNQYNNKDYLKTEVFGTPSCYICLSNNKNDSSLKLFHCSHCDKLFCKYCLPIHYQAHFKNIEDSYSKYISNSANEDIMAEVLPSDMGNCRLIFFIILILLFNFVYLLPIFSLKAIISTLETIMYNCIKKFFTTKIEKPDELFNFYDIFFDRVNTLSLDFDLMMIMNWLGHRTLNSCGFMFSIILFFIINFGYFIMMYNFDFLKYNEYNKYNFLKIIQLLLCYLVIFIGAGSSSLLSQEIYLEFFRKYQRFMKERKKKKKNKKNILEDNKSKIEKNIDNSFNNNNDNNKLIDDDNDKEKQEENDNNNVNNNNENNNEDNNNNNENDYNNVNNDKNNNEENNDDKNNENDNENNQLQDNSNISKTLDETRTENRKKTKTNLGSFFTITLVTLLSFFANFYINLEILNYKNKKDEQIIKEYNNTLIFINETNYTNINLTLKLYESHKKYFFNIYLFYYILCIGTSIFLYLIIKCFCLRKKKSKNNNNVDLIIDSQNIGNTVIRELEADKKTYNYTICKFCGFFYLSEKINFRGDYSCCSKFSFCLKDFFVLNCKTFLDCCNITFCQVLNIIFNDGKEKCNCNCNCCNDISYEKSSEKFCFCYQEKRKYKWLHDYLTSEVQKELAPYVLEYLLLGLLIITFQQKFVDFKVSLLSNIKLDKDFSFENIFKILYDFKILIIILMTLIIFFLLTREASRKSLSSKDAESENDNEENKVVNFLQSFSIFKGIHILVLINSIISLIYSVLYFIGIQDFGDYIIIPILMYKYFYFSFNYYCIAITDQENNHELILSGGILLTIYIKIWDFSYALIQTYIINERYLYLFQGILSIVIILFFIFYLVYSRFKYSICYNCVNINFCGCCQVCGPCCIYNTYCIEGKQYCDCACCDKNSCCYNEKCERCFICCECCSCFAETNEDEIIR